VSTSPKFGTKKIILKKIPSKYVVANNSDKSNCVNDKKLLSVSRGKNYAEK